MASNQQILDHAKAVAEINKRILAGVAAVAKDVSGLKDKLNAIENSPRPLSPEDQASLDGARADAQAAAEGIEALDALTENVPVEPPAGPGPEPS